MMSNILVIDDDPAVRGAFKLILEEDGYSVREAENGLEGIEMVKQSRQELQQKTAGKLSGTRAAEVEVSQAEDVPLRRVWPECSQQAAQLARQLRKARRSQTQQAQ